MREISAEAVADTVARLCVQANTCLPRDVKDGIAAARGEYLAFCDADDYILPNTLEALYAALTRAGADTAGCGHRLLWPDGRTEDYAGALPAGVYGPEELREHSHNPMKFYNIRQMILPSYTMGRDYALLNQLRAAIRETEVAAANAFYDGFRFSRSDIIEELNRLSSALHIMMCKYLAGDYKGAAK